jgi:phosphatidate cytidylyltransferase
MAPLAEGARPAGGQSGGQGLATRMVSAAVLLPLAIGAVWLGGTWWAALVGVFAVAMAWEWSHVCAPSKHGAIGRSLGVGASGLASMIVVAGALLLTAAGDYVPAIVLLALAGAGIAASDTIVRDGRGKWQGLGLIYVGLPCIAIIGVRAQHETGLATLIWLLAVVIAVDTGAYAVGRLIGGPRLAPRISPRKTWAGLCGGVASAMLVGWIVALWLGEPRWLGLIIVSAVLALVEQAGDLAESAFKRRFGVKDSSRLIPGHGGVLDRVDGLLAVSLAVGIAEYSFGGILAWTR